MKPSDIDLNDHYLPLINTFHKSESEVAAALMILVCQESGDTWKAVTLPMVGNTLKDIGPKSKMWMDRMTNPFLQPNFHRLVNDGYAEWDKTQPEPYPISFTQKGLDTLKGSKHVKGAP